MYIGAKDVPQTLKANTLLDCILNNNELWEHFKEDPATSMPVIQYISAILVPLTACLVSPKCGQFSESKQAKGLKRGLFCNDSTKELTIKEQECNESAVKPSGCNHHYH
jgi:hypothetical protein